jgi:hypothetical protein
MTLRGKHRLRVFENRVLRRLIGPMRDNVIEGWRNSSPNIVTVIKSRRMKWAGHVAHMEEKRNEYRSLLGMPERKRPLGRSRRSEHCNEPSGYTK